VNIHEASKFINPQFEVIMGYFCIYWQIWQCRISLFFCGAALAGAFGGILAYIRFLKSFLFRLHALIYVVVVRLSDNRTCVLDMSMLEYFITKTDLSALWILNWHI
jgi:hypothetical protein